MFDLGYRRFDYKRLSLMTKTLVLGPECLFFLILHHILNAKAMAWAYQWDRTLVPGGELMISKDKSISGAVETVPEPSTFALLGTAALGLLGFLRRRRKPA